MTILSTTPPIVRPRFAGPQYASWQEAMKDAVRNPDELCRLLDLPPEFAVAAKKMARQFPLFVPRGFLTRIEAGNPADPLLRQVLPLVDEMIEVPGFAVDPVRDDLAKRQPGLLHKYEGRVLLVTTGTCSIHCRYCFRRHFTYDEAPRTIAEWQPALDEIAADESIREVILSGGDPLTLVDSTLSMLVDHIVRIRQIRRLRIHTRLPIVIPERVTDGLLGIIGGSRLTPIVVLHANHANELDSHVAAAIGRLADASILLFNQAVLLKGVNDSADSQAALCERLVDLRVVPYYLHQLDRVAGAAHFEVSAECGQQIIEALRARLPGYAVPRYVQEVAGKKSKIELI